MLTSVVFLGGLLPAGAGESIFGGSRRLARRGPAIWRRRSRLDPCALRRTRAKDDGRVQTLSAKWAIGRVAAGRDLQPRKSQRRVPGATRDSRWSRNTSNSLKTLGPVPFYPRRIAPRFRALSSTNRCRRIAAAAALSLTKPLNAPYNESSSIQLEAACTL
jgi:hypothetical protein